MKKRICILVITALVVLAMGGVAMAAGGATNVLDYPFTITVKPPPPPDILVEQLTDPKLEIIQGESVQLAYRIINPITQPRWATVQFFNYSTSGMGYDVMLDGVQYIMESPFVIDPGTSRIIEFTFTLPAGQYPCRVVIDQLLESPPEKG